VRIRVPPRETITYRPHIFEMLKFGWIQFLATYVILWYLFSRLERAVFRFRILETRVISDVDKKLHRF
jgi:transmembrane protein 231